MRFFLEGDAPKVTPQQKGVNFKKRAVYTKAELEAAKKWFVSRMKPHAPKKPLTGPVAVEIVVVWPYRAEDLSNASKREAAEMAWRIPHSGKPDVDNFAKLVLDSLVAAGFFDKDNHVYRLTVEKWYGAREGVAIMVMQDRGLI